MYVLGNRRWEECAWDHLFCLNTRGMRSWYLLSPSQPEVLTTSLHLGIAPSWTGHWEGSQKKQFNLTLQHGKFRFCLHTLWYHCLPIKALFKMPHVSRLARQDLTKSAPAIFWFLVVRKALAVPYNKTPGISLSLTHSGLSASRRDYMNGSGLPEGWHKIVSKAWTDPNGDDVKSPTWSNVAIALTKRLCLVCDQVRPLIRFSAFQLLISKMANKFYVISKFTEIIKSKPKLTWTIKHHWALGNSIVKTLNISRSNKIVEKVISNPKIYLMYEVLASIKWKYRGEQLIATGKLFQSLD